MDETHYILKKETMQYVFILNQMHGFGNYYSNQRSNRSTKKCGRSNASIYAGVGATTFRHCSLLPSRTPEADFLNSQKLRHCRVRGFQTKIKAF